MRRRRLLTVGLVTGGALAVLGGAWAWLRPPRRDGVLDDEARALFAALLPAVLPGLLPEDAAGRAQAVHGHLQRVQDAIAGLSPPLQAEVDELLTVLLAPPGRLALTGLGTHWREAEPPAVREALDRMRRSSVAVRQQAYHALRDLTNASWFADPGTWAAVGYPGPMQVGT